MLEEIVLLADPRSKVWDQAQEILQYSINKKIKVQVIEVLIKRFRNNEKKIKIKENIRRKNCFFLHDSSKTPEEWFFELISVLYTLKNSGAKEVTAVLPCLLYSRQDRKDESRVAINAKFIADCISLYANRVITIDLHAEQIQGFYNIPLDNLYSFPSVVNYLKEKYLDFLDNLVVVSTDAGGTKLAYSFSRRLAKIGIKSDIAIGSKNRPKEGEVAEYKIIGNVFGKNALIVDDIIDSGNTLIKCAESLRKGGAKKIIVYGTHGIFSEGFEKFKNIDKIFVSNTIFQKGNSICEVINLTGLLSEAIYREALGESLSELFD